MHISIVSSSIVCIKKGEKNSQTLDRNHEERPSADELLNHPFLAEVSQDDPVST